MYEVTDVYSCARCDEVETFMSGEIFDGVAMLSGNCPLCGELLVCEVEMIGGK
jgi:DNA polymerase III alpha subunit (gram-positive type)